MSVVGRNWAAAGPESPSAQYWRSVFEDLGAINPGQDYADGIPIKNFHVKDGLDIKKLAQHLHEQKSSHLERMTGMPRSRLLYLLRQLQAADKNNDGVVTLTEWRLFLKENGKEFLGSKGVTAGAFRVILYAPTYTCSPPTVFLLGITLLQITCYVLSIYAPWTLGIEEYAFGDRAWPIDSYLIYDPHRRREAWRFASYMFLHGSHEHIAFNCLVQLLVGIPLEMSQLGWVGSLRVLGLYLAGVVLGSLGASVAQPDKYLLGASAGVYALILAHLATLILNWTEDGLIYKERSKSRYDDTGASMRLNPWIRGLRLGFVLLFIVVDVGTVLYKIYYLGETSNTSYAGHAFGALAGLLIGVFVLENRRVEDWEKIFQVMALVAFFLLLCSFVAWHVIGTSTGWFPAEAYP